MADQNDHSSLYFIVGALVVVAIIASFVFIGNDEIDVSGDPATGVEQTEPAAGTSSSLEMRVDDDGASATTTNNNSEPAGSAP